MATTCGGCGIALEGGGASFGVAELCPACAGSGGVGDITDLITLASRAGLLDERTARAKVGNEEPTVRLLAGHGLLNEVVARELLGKHPDALCPDCGRPLRAQGPERVCPPCGLRVTPDRPSDAQGHRLPPEVAEAARQPANVFGRYIKLRELGKGGMGAVYLAHDTLLGRPAALKLPRYDEDEDLSRLRSEALTAASLNHPNIAQVYEVGEAHGRVYLAMQYVDGESPGECTPRRSAQIVRDAARGVAAAHERGVLHRDLKPGNLMIDRTGQVFVMDFGLAKQHAVGEKASQSAVVGTAPFMAPEQVRGEPLDEQADVYGLGATIYALVTGMAPFSGGQEQVLRQVVTDEPIAPRRLRPAIPRDLEVIIHKAMCKEAARRYASAEDLARDLERFLAGEPIAARPPSFTYRTRRRIARNPWAWGLGAVLATAVLLGLPAAAAIQYVRARAAGERGLEHLQERRWREAATELERSATIWRLARYEPARAAAQRELERQAVWTKVNALGVQYDKVYEALGQAVRDAEDVGMGALALPPDRVAQILARVEAVLDGLDSTWAATSLPQAYRGWVLANLGRAGEAQEQFDRAVDAGGVEKGDPYGLIFRARWRARALYDRFQPQRLTFGGASDVEFTAPRLPTELEEELREVAGELASLRGWQGWEETREARHYGEWVEGLMAMAEGQFAEAADRLREVERSPELAAEARYLAGMAWLLGGEYERAEDGFGWAVRDRDAWGKGWEWLGMARHARAEKILRSAPAEAGKILDDAIEAYDALLVRNPELVEAYNGRGVAYWSLGNAEVRRGIDPRESYRRAIEDCERALARNSEDADAYCGRGLAYLSLGDAEAERGIDPRESYLRAIGDFERALVRNPELVQAYTNRGNAYRSLGDAEAARGIDARESYLRSIEDYERALVRNPEYVLAYTNRGNAYRSLGDAEAARGIDPRESYGRAIEDCEHALARNPEVVGAYTNRGNAYRRLGDAEAERGIDPRESYCRAIEDYKRALGRNPEYVLAYTNRGNAYRSLGNAEAARGIDPRESYRRAIEDYARALARNPEYLDAHNNRGVAYLSLGDAEAARGIDPRESYRRAIEDFERALVRNPELVEAYNNLGDAYRSLGEAEAARGISPRESYRCAIEACESALARNPDLVNAYGNRGNTYWRLGEAEAAQGIDPSKSYRRAIEDHARALTRNPELVGAYYSRGNAYGSLGDAEAERGIDPRESYRRAIEDYERALGRNPEYVEAYNNRGGVYQRLGDAEAARGGDAEPHYERALADYDAALGRNASLWQAHGNKGILYERLGRWSDAVRAYEAAYAIVGEGCPPLQGWLDNARGRLEETTPEH